MSKKIYRVMADWVSSDECYVAAESEEEAGNIAGSSWDPDFDAGEVTSYDVEEIDWQVGRFELINHGVTREEALAWDPQSIRTYDQGRIYAEFAFEGSTDEFEQRMAFLDQVGERAREDFTKMLEERKLST